MHNHDPDLILSLSTGDLEGAAATAATAEVEACAECSRDLELQRIALESLAMVPAARLSDMERSTLRSEMHSKLGLEQPAEVVERPKRRLINWSAIAVAAVVLTGIVMVGPLLGLLGGSDSGGDASDFSTALEESADDAAGTQQLSRDNAAAVTGDETSTTTAAAEAAPPAVAADGTVSIESAPGEVLDGNLYHVGALDLAELRDMLDGGFSAAFDSTLFDEAIECQASGIEELGAETGEAIAYGDYQGSIAVVVAYTFAGEDTEMIVIHDVIDCSILASDP